MLRLVSRFSAAASVAAVSALLAAMPASAADVTVSDAWARASAGMARAGAAFMTITNAGSADDRVVGAATDVAQTAELHTHIKEGDVMKMRQVEDIPVPAGQTVMLQPGGLHVMLMGLDKPLEEGQSFTVTVTLEKAGTIEVPVTVRAPGAMGPMHGMKHQ